MATQDELSDRAREGLEHLQAAAKEMIAAGRAMLDAADELIDDPSVASQLVGTLGMLAKLAANAVNQGAADADDGDGGSRVQRIKVS